MRNKGSCQNELREHEPGIIGIGTEPKFAIGQRCVLVQTPEGNVLFDCITFLDEQTISKVMELGGIKAIVLSHPHFQASCCSWADAFGVPVYMHAADQAWTSRKGHPRMQYWSGDVLPLGGGVSAVRIGGHFPGSCVLHIASSARDGKPVLLTSDNIHCVPHRRWLSFMYSFPNLLPLPASEVARVRGVVSQLAFDRLYGAFWSGSVVGNARDCVMESADRYLKALAGEYHQDQDGGR